MKKASTLLVVALIFSCQLSYSQVKRQYQDDAFAETTVVIKEDAATSDLDVLNTYFDMDDVGMGQVIRITTETEVPKKPAPEKLASPQVVPVKSPVVQEPAAALTVISTVGNIALPKEQKVAGAPAAPRQRSVRVGGSNAARAKSSAGQWSGKRVKKHKRKRNKNRGSSKCYGF